MAKFIGVKIVEAESMTIEEARKVGVVVKFDGPSDSDGYLVTYPDGYQSWCPKQQFEEANRETVGMPFGHAVEAARKGAKISRSGWNGKNMFVAYQEPDSGSKMHLPYLYMKTADGLFVPWLASQTDVLSDDWCIVG